MKKINVRTEIGEETSLFKSLKRCLIFSAVFFLLSLLLLFLFSIIFINVEDPTAYLNMIGKISLYISAFLCSIVLSRKNASGWFFSGIMLGAMTTGLVFAISLFYPGSTEGSVVWLLLTPATAILGAFIGRKRTDKPFKHKKRRK